MFRRSRETAPSVAASALGRVLEPLLVLPWGPLALSYLGVPIVVGVHHIVVRDEDYQTAIRKLVNSKFVFTVPDRCPPIEVMEPLADPQGVLKGINDGYKGLDQFSTTFNYPLSSLEKREQVILIPNSLAHLPLRPAYPTNQYGKYNNILYPLEWALVESFVKVALNDEEEHDITLWGEALRSWIAMLVGYLDICNDILDSCEDQLAVEWFSAQFGRGHEATFGPFDRRITKRLGSGKEMPVDIHFYETNSAIERCSRVRSQENIREHAVGAQLGPFRGM